MLRNDSIIYGSLMDEYHRNLQMQQLAEKVIQESPKGSVQIINMNGHPYCYLKYRDGNKIVSKYLGKQENPKVMEISKQIQRRNRYRQNLKKLREEAKWLKQVLRIKEEVVQ